MNNQILFGIAVIPAVIGLVEVCKTLGLPTRAAPALAVAFGVLAALAQLEAGTWPWIQAVVLGVSFGLSASGLYAGVKTVLPALTSAPPTVPLKEIIPPAAASARDGHHAPRGAPNDTATPPAQGS